MQIRLYSLKSNSVKKTNDSGARVDEARGERHSGSNTEGEMV